MDYQFNRASGPFAEIGLSEIETDHAGQFRVICGQQKMRIDILAAAKFRVGEAVDFNPGRSAMPPSTREYKVLKVLPREQGDQLYRIKSISELFERVARESELTPRR